MSAIKELKPLPEIEHVFTCKRCGAHLGRRVAFSTHKFGGFQLGAPTVRVCKNCLNGSNMEF